MAGPLASLTTLLIASILTGLAVETSWMVGVPSLAALCVVIYWSCGCILSWKDDREEVSKTPLITLTLIMATCGISSIACSLYYPLAVNSLTIILLAAVPPHCFLLGDPIPKKDSNNVDISVASIIIAAPLTLAGIFIAGLCYNIGWSAAVPGALLLAYSIIMLCIGLHFSALLKSSVSVAVSLLIFAACTAFSFITYFYAPLWCPVAVLGTFCALTLVFMTDVEAKHPFAEYGGCGAVLQLIAAAAAGAAIAADMPLCWLIVSVCALLPANVIMANDLCGRKQWPEKNQRTKNVKLLRVQIGMIILFASLTIAFLISFHFAYETVPALIPFILVAIAMLCILMIHVIYRMESRARWLTGVGFLLFCIAYIYCLSAICLHGSTHAKDLGMHEAWRVHAIATLILFALCLHCWALACSKSKNRHFLREARMAGTIPPAATAAVAPAKEPLATPVASLLVLIGCSIMGVIASCASFLAAVPMLTVFCGVTVWTCTCMLDLDNKSHRIIAPVSYFLQFASAISLFVAHYHARYLCTVFVLSIISHTAILYVVECQPARIEVGFFRVSLSSQLISVAAVAFAYAAEMPVEWTVMASSLFIIQMLAMSIGIAHLHYYNVMNDKLVPVVKRPRLRLIALSVMAGIGVALLSAYHFLHNEYPVLIPFVFLGVTAVYLLAVYIVYTCREHMKYHGRTAFLLVLLFCYLVFVCYRLHETKDGASMTVLAATALIGALTFHFICFSIAISCADIDKEKQKAARAASLRPIRKGAGVPYAPPGQPRAAAAAAAATRPAAIVMQREADSDYDSVASDDYRGGIPV